MPRVWVTSDTHFGHRHIFQEGYCPSRLKWMEAPTIEAHDRALALLWNQTVHPDDIVIHCGDFAFGSAKDIMQYRLRLNGTIWMVRGNHDRGLKSMRNCICTTHADVVGKGLKLKVGPHIVHVRHTPMVSPPGEPVEYGFSQEEHDAADFLWHGHVHDRALSLYYKPLSTKHVAWGIDTHPDQPITPMPLPVTLLDVIN
jgi:calcineurin-like phosphoesterase family protein